MSFNETDRAAMLPEGTKAREGMAATYCIGSDRYAGRIIAASKTGHRATWQRVEVDGKVGMTHECTLRRDGTYYVIGSKYGHLILGVAKTDLDAGF